jgi:hypothetical protein
MKVIIGAVVMVVLMIGAQSAFAAQLGDAPFSKHPMADVLSGLAIGAQDAKDSCDHPDGCHMWILMRGHGFINQTQEFIRGYVHGFCSKPEFALGGGSDAEQADIRCDKGPEAASWASPGSLDSANTKFWTPPN